MEAPDPEEEEDSEEDGSPELRLIPADSDDGQLYPCLHASLSAVAQSFGDKDKWL